jgi:hypothetical protein
VHRGTQLIDKLPEVAFPFLVGDRDESAEAGQQICRTNSASRETDNRDLFIL